jgi:cell division transport system permease protein
MAQKGKFSSKRSKPSYFMTVLGVSLVLFFLGLLGWIAINSRKLEMYFRESVEMRILIRENTPDTNRVALQNYLQAQPYTKTLKYTDKETAKAEWIKSGGEDFTEFLDNNILPTSLDLTLKSEYVQADSMKAIQASINANSIVAESSYPTAVVEKLNDNVRKVSLSILGIVILLAIIVIVLIDNTIRLAMFSNRFLIKTMQMVGATRWFISRPMDIRAIINGAIAAIIAIAGMIALIWSAEKWVPGLQTLHDNKLLLLLFGIMFIIGIAITLISTHRSVVKYLKLKLDELY